jgi:hypothetical protein
MTFERGPEPNRREWLVATVAMLAGCGGVDSGGTGTGNLPTLAVGAITGFGSIVVNGIRFDDTLAVVTGDDGRARTREQLRLGMRTEVIASAVSLVGGTSTATAASIRIRSELEGPVESIDAQAGTLRVLGQTVVLVGTTVLDIGASPLAAGDLVEVHATRDLTTGRYVASRIERRASLAAYNIRGVGAPGRPGEHARAGQRGSRDVRATVGCRHVGGPVHRRGHDSARRPRQR